MKEILERIKSAWRNVWEMKSGAWSSNHGR